MSDAERLLQEMTEVIVREADPERVVLFGSWARGEAGPDSDVDLLVVESGPFGPARSRHREMVHLWKKLRRFRVPKDVLVFTRDEVERWSDSPGHVIARALREGRDLYVRP